MARIESLLSARMFLVPQLVRDRLYFLSNLSGHLSFYAMDHGGSVPEPLLPPHIALQDPHLVGGYYFYIFEKFGKIIIMTDNDGDEDYQPMMIPIEGGYPEPAFGNNLDGYKAVMGNVDKDTGTVYLSCPSHSEPMNILFRANIDTGEFTELARSTYGAFPFGRSDDHSKVIIGEGYSAGDNVIRLWESGNDEMTLLYGIPIEDREEEQTVEPNGVGGVVFIEDDQALLVETTIFEDTGGLGYLNLSNPGEMKPVTFTGMVHTGFGEFNDISHLKGNRYAFTYNIDGETWVYEGSFDLDTLTVTLDTVIVGQDELSKGVLESRSYDEDSDRHALSFSTAISPTQLYTIEGEDRHIIQHTRERSLGLPDGVLSSGEDASYTSFDGLRVSARLYLPDESLGFEGARPLVYYIHGGPQSQERPDFAWFSMPLIQFLTLRGFAVFVPNVRGSTGYGLNYMKQVDRDWGGADMADHVHAMTEVLTKDPRIDTTRAAVTGRSYGGYMTLMLAGNHPELWSAACDMFGPYDLFTFMERIPETWRPYFYIALGHPEKDKDFLTDRSPKTHLGNLACPMLVVQGKNDPRVVETESSDLVEGLRAQGKDIDYLMFEDEGHGVQKYKNRVTVYNSITEYFEKYLKP